MEQIEAEHLMKNLRAIAKRYSYKYVSPLILRKIYKDYCKWRSLIKCREGWWNSWRDKMRMYAFDSSMVHYLLERCFWIRYGNNKVVCHLITLLFELDGHLGEIIDFELLTGNPSNWRLQIVAMTPNRSYTGSLHDYFVTRSAWKYFEMAAVEIDEPFDYFIEHSYTRRVLFNGQRFAEQFIVNGHLPCTMAYKLPEIIPKLLRHGLFVTADPKDKNFCKFFTGIIEAYFSSNNKLVKHEIQEMGNILLRAVKSIDSSMLLKCQKVWNSSHLIQNVLEKAIKKDIFPELEKRCRGPQDLQHLCRCSIRKYLYGNWHLPSGIYFLPLPPRLKNYIDLKLD